MFQGETAITVDEKGRMTVPTVHRDLLARDCGNRLVLTYNPFERGCVWLYMPSAWEKVRDDLLARPNTLKTVRSLQQKLVGSAAHLELDGNGRVTLPPSHRQAARTEKKEALRGVGDQFELWSEQAHRDLIEQTLSDADLDDGLLDLKL